MTKFSPVEREWARPSWVFFAPSRWREPMMTSPSGMVEKHHPRNLGAKEQHGAEPLMNLDHSQRAIGEEEINIGLFPAIAYCRVPLLEEPDLTLTSTVFIST